MLSFRTNGKVECTGMSIQQPNPVGNHCFFNARACFCVCDVAIWLELMFLATSDTWEIFSIDVTQITQLAGYVTY